VFKVASHGVSTASRCLLMGVLACLPCYSRTLLHGSDAICMSDASRETL